MRDESVGRHTNWPAEYSYVSSNPVKSDFNFQSTWSWFKESHSSISFGIHYVPLPKTSGAMDRCYDSLHLNSTLFFSLSHFFSLHCFSLYHSLFRLPHFTLPLSLGFSQLQLIYNDSDRVLTSSSSKFSLSSMLKNKCAMDSNSWTEEEKMS